MDPTKEQVERLAALGLCDAEIALKFGRTRSWTNHFRHRHGIAAGIKRGGQRGNDGGASTRKGVKRGPYKKPEPSAAVRASMNAMWRKKAPPATSFESIDAFIARGGKIVVCEPMAADGAISTVPAMSSKSGFRVAAR